MATYRLEYEISDVGGLLVLETACCAYDRAEALRLAIARDGQVISTPQGLKDHPALKHELAARGLLLRALGRLGINYEPLRPLGRPGHAIGWRPER